MAQIEEDFFRLRWWCTTTKGVTGWLSCNLQPYKKASAVELAEGQVPRQLWLPPPFRTRLRVVASPAVVTPPCFGPLPARGRRCVCMRKPVRSAAGSGGKVKGLLWRSKVRPQQLCCSVFFEYIPTVASFEQQSLRVDLLRFNIIVFFAPLLRCVD